MSHGYEQGEARAYTERFLAADLAAQPSATYRETIERVRRILVDEARREQATPSALWRLMPIYGLTPSMIKAEALAPRLGMKSHKVK